MTTERRILRVILQAAMGYTHGNRKPESKQGRKHQNRSQDKPLHTQRPQLPPEPVHPAPRIADIVKLGLAVRPVKCLARLHEAPEGPHAVRRGAPGGDLRVEAALLVG